MSDDVDHTHKYWQGYEAALASGAVLRDQLGAERDRLRGENRRLKAGASTLAAEKDAEVTRERDAAWQTVTALYDENDRIRAKVIDLENKLDISGKVGRVLADADLRKDNDRLLNDIGHKDNVLASAAATAADLRGERAGLTDKIDALEKQLGHSRAIATGLMTENDRLRSSHDVLEGDLAWARDESNQDKEERRNVNRLVVLRGENHRLRGDRAELTARAEGLEVERDHHRLAEVKLREENKRLLADNRELRVDGIDREDSCSDKPDFLARLYLEHMGDGIVARKVPRCDMFRALDRLICHLTKDAKRLGEERDDYGYRYRRVLGKLRGILHGEQSL